jgi:hypothetical protein
MDFIWDGNHNLVRKTAWWWDGMPSAQPSKTQVCTCAMQCGYFTCVVTVAFPVRSLNLVVCCGVKVGALCNTCFHSLTGHFRKCAEP